jgi:hypothetical protein
MLRASLRSYLRMTGEPANPTSRLPAPAHHAPGQASLRSYLRMTGEPANPTSRRPDIPTAHLASPVTPTVAHRGGG